MHGGTEGDGVDVQGRDVMCRARVKEDMSRTGLCTHAKLRPPTLLPAFVYVPGLVWSAASWLGPLHTPPGERTTEYITSSSVVPRCCSVSSRLHRVRRLRSLPRLPAAPLGA